MRAATRASLLTSPLHRSRLGNPRPCKRPHRPSPPAAQSPTQTRRPPRPPLVAPSSRPNGLGNSAPAKRRPVRHRRPRIAQPKLDARRAPPGRPIVAPERTGKQHPRETPSSPSPTATHSPTQTRRAPPPGHPSSPYRREGTAREAVAARNAFQSATTCRP